MGKKYSTDKISIGGHTLDESRMVILDNLIEGGLHSEAGYLTEESGTTKLTDAEIAEMGYIKTYTQLTSAEIAAMGYTGNQDLSSYYRSNGGTYSLGSGSHMNLKHTTAGGFSEFSMSNNNDEKLVIGSIGSGYTNANWAGSRYIYSTAGELRIKAASNLRLYSGGHAHTGNLAVTFDSNQDAAFTGNISAAGFVGALTGNVTGNATGNAGGVSKTGYGSNNFTFQQTSGAFAGYSGWANYYIGNHGDGSTYYNTTHIMPFWGAPKYSRLAGGAQSAVYDYWTSEGVINSDHNINAPIFYDSNDTSYYLNPASTSNLNGLTVNGSLDMTDDSISIDNQKGFSNSGAWTRNQTPHGYIDFGPANTSHAHIYTDRPNFYFNKDLQVSGQTVYHTGNLPSIPSGNSIIDWTTDQGGTNIHSGNYTNTTYDLSGYLTTAGKAADSNLLDGLNSTAYMRDDGWNTSPGQDANTQTGMRSDFSYGNNAPNVGELLRFGAGGYSTQFSSQYSGAGKGLNFRTRNGDSATYNPWYGIWHTGNLTSNSQLTNGSNYVSYVNTDQIGASLFYDLNDSNYFLDLNATSRLNRLQTVSTGVNKNSSQTTKDGLSLYGAYTGGEATYGMMFTGTAGSGTHGAVTSDWATYFTMNNSNNRGWIFRRVGSGNSASISAGGAATFDTSVTSNKFYDTNNTNSWLDIRDSSGNYHLKANEGGMYFDAPVHYFRELSNSSQKLTIDAGTATATSSLRAPIFYDSNDTNYYLNPASTSKFNVLNTYSYQGNSNVGGTGSASWHPSGIYSAGYNWLYGGINGGGGSATNFSDVRANIFYDYNDTSYYVDPASTGTALNIQGAINVKSSHSGGNIALDYFHSSDTYSGNMVMFMSEPGITHDGGGIGNNIATNSPYYGRAINHGYGVYLRFYKTNGHFEFWNTQGNAGTAGGQGTRRFYGDASGNTFSQTSSRAPIFYDSNDTNYYLNPASTSNLNIVQAVQFQGSLAGTASNANTLDSFSSESFLRSDADDTVNAGVTYTWTRTDTAGLVFTNNSYNTKLYMGGWTTTNSNDISRIRTSSGNLHIDSAANGALYLNWYSNGKVMSDSIIESSASVRAPIFYDTNDTGYYVNPAGASIVKQVKLINSTTPLVLKVNSNYKSWVHHIASNDSYIFAPSTAYGGESWDWANQMSISSSGVVTANNFVLSSDKRSKTKIKDLTRDNIDVSWKSFEMKGNEGDYRTGVIAQELEETHPEFVNTDPKGFKSVKYIDLLIAKIAELEARLEKLEK